MLKNTINGLDKILLDDIPKGSVILVTGAEGTLKLRSEDGIRSD